MFRRSSLLVCAVLLIATGRTIAQDSDATAAPRKFGKPIARVWYSRLSPGSSFQYMMKVAREMELKSSLFMIGGPGMDVPGVTPRVGSDQSSVELKGMMVYVARGLVPDFVQLHFRRVKDEKEFKKFVNERRSTFGDMAELITHKNGYEVKTNFRTVQFGGGVPPGGDGEEGSRGAVVIAFSVGSSSQPGGDGDAPKPPPTVMTSMSTYYRLDGDIMFEGNFPEVLSMELPDLKSLTLTSKQQKLDLYADVDLRQIPIGFKQLFWNTLQTTTNTFLQQFDEEPDEEYAVRRSTGEYTLELVRAGVFDVDRIRFSLNFAKGEEPLRASMTIDARENSNLAKQLGQVSRGVSRFARLREEKTPLTIASAWQMPEAFRTVLKAVFDNGRTRLERELVSDADSLVAIDDIFTVLSDTVEKGAADAIVKLGGNLQDGFSLYGGMRIEGAGRLSKSLSTLLSRLPSAPDTSVRVVREGEREYLSFRLDELRLPGIDESREKLPAQLHFTVAESCLWFSLGGPNSFSTLKECLAADSAEVRNATTGSPFLIDLKLSEWLGGDEAETATGFSRLPHQSLARFEQALHRSLSESMNFQVSGPFGDAMKTDMSFRDSFLQKALKDGQDELHLEIDTSPTRVQADATIGEGLVRFVIARVLDVQGRAMENLQFQVFDDGDGEVRVRAGGSIRAGSSPDEPGK